MLGGGMALSAPAIPADAFPVGQAATGKRVATELYQTREYLHYV